MTDAPPEARCSGGRSQHRFACSCGGSREVCRHCGAKNPYLGTWRSDGHGFTIGGLNLGGGHVVQPCRCEPCTECGEREWKHVYRDKAGRKSSHAKARSGQRVCGGCGHVEREYRVIHRRVRG